MGIVQKKSVRRYKRKLSAEEKLDKDLKDCMKCKYFWGNYYIDADMTNNERAEEIVSRYADRMVD